MPSSNDGASMRAPRRPTLTRLSTIVMTAALAASGLLGVSPHASAATSSPQTAATGTTHQAAQRTAQQRTAQQRTAQQRFRSRADKVLTVTRHQKGDPYQYGAAGPSRFDCSGLVMYVFQHALGKSLPHNAEAQYQRSNHIARKYLRRGDLVFQVDSSGYAYHVGIYAGTGYMWDAPHSGAHVHRHKMYQTRWRFGRLIHPRR
jgi:cell wall-associated NlpC family hydrolase